MEQILIPAYSNNGNLERIKAELFGFLGKLGMNVVGLGRSGI